MNSLTRNSISSYIPRRKPTGHKGTYGTVLVWAGSDELPGAAYLCANAAFRAGCGKVIIATDSTRIAYYVGSLP